MIETLSFKLNGESRELTVDVLKEANARGKEIANAVKLRDEGFVSHEVAADALGIG